MPRSWNEIKTRSTIFSMGWENEIREDGEAKSFRDGFFARSQDHLLKMLKHLIRRYNPA